MKTNIITLILGISLFCGPLRVSSQETGFPAETDRQGRAKDLATTLQIARYIDDVNNADEYDRTILMYAAGKGYTQACRILLRRGADPDLQALDGATAIMFASYNGHNRIVKLLLESGADPDIRSVDGFTSLMMAAQPDINETDGTNAILITAEDNIVETLIRTLSGDTDSARTGKFTAKISRSGDGLEAVELSERKDQDSDFTDVDRTTAFIRAEQSGHIAIVKVMAKSETVFDQGKTVRFTDMMVASMNGYDDIVRMLKDKGAGL